MKYNKFNEKKESFKKSVKSRKEALDKHRKRLINKICKFFVLIFLFLVNSIISFSALTGICFVLSKIPRILSIVISTALSLLLDSVIYLQPINFNINKILLFISIPSMFIGIFLAYCFKEKCLN